MNQSLHLLYHELRPAGSPYQYVVSCSAFEAHCALYACMRAEMGDHLRPEITFDDGNSSCVRYAMPILNAKGLSAHFFITAGWTSVREGFMTWADLRELSAAGHRMGAHGMTHKLLTRCTAAELQEELSGARKLLEDGLGQRVDSLSLPGGRADRRVFAACHEAGYTEVFTSEPFAVDLQTRPAVVGRLNLTGAATVADIEALLTPASGRLRRAQRIGQVKSAMKGLLGDDAYARLWAVLNRQERPGSEREAAVR